MFKSGISSHFYSICCFRDRAMRQIQKSFLQIQTHLEYFFGKQSQMKVIRKGFVSEHAFKHQLDFQQTLHSEEYGNSFNQQRWTDPNFFFFIGILDFLKVNPWTKNFNYYVGTLLLKIKKWNRSRFNKKSIILSFVQGQFLIVLRCSYLEYMKVVTGFRLRITTQNLVDEAPDSNSGGLTTTQRTTRT